MIQKFTSQCFGTQITIGEKVHQWSPRWYLSQRYDIKFHTLAFEKLFGFLTERAIIEGKHCNPTHGRAHCTAYIINTARPRLTFFDEQRGAWHVIYAVYRACALQ